MSNRALARKVDTRSDTDSSDHSSLVELDTVQADHRFPVELNQKISLIDAEIDGLRTEIEHTNQGMRAGLSELAARDSDLSATVSESYRKIGELDDSYRQLADRSTAISTEIKVITKTIREVAHKSESDVVVLTQGYEQMTVRVQELAAKSKQTTQALKAGIKENSRVVTALEQELVARIDQLAQTTAERDDELADRSEKLLGRQHRSEAEIQQQQARLLKLQAVDQALEKRAAGLENSAADLAKKTKELTRSTTLLTKRTEELGEAITALQAKTEEHQERIGDLETRADDTEAAVATLDGRENRRFWVVGGVLLLLILAFVGFLTYQNANWQTEAVVNSELRQDLSGAQSEVLAARSDISGLDSDLGAVQQQVSDVQSGMTTNQTDVAAIDHRLTDLGDEIDSLNGRLTNLYPTRTFGNDNVIHGPQWLNAQSPDSYVIHLAFVREQQGLYELAERYGRDLQQEFAFAPVQYNNARQYALIYGPFDSRGAANAAMARLPRYIERQRPSVQSVATIQRHAIQE